MTLLSLDTPSYIKRTKVYTNFIESKSLNPDVFNIVYEAELPLLVQNVVGIELTNYAFSTFIFPTFVGRYKTVLPNQLYEDGLPIDYVRNPINGSKTIDIELGDAAGVDTISLTFDFEAITFTPPLQYSLTNVMFEQAVDYLSLFALVFSTVIYPALPIVGAFDPAAYALDGNFSGVAPVTMNIRRILAPFDYGRVRFL